MPGEESGQIYLPPSDVQKEAHCSSMQQYREMYRRSVEEPQSFWGEIAQSFYWKTPPPADKFLQYNFDVGKGPIFIKWMEGGVTNVCYNMVDRNINRGLGDKIAFFW